MHSPKAQTVPEDIPEVVDDFEIAEEEMLKISERPENIAKVANRIEKYEFKKKFHDFREGKKLLVLDIDYTLFGKYSSLTIPKLGGEGSEVDFHFFIMSDRGYFSQNEKIF